ncbi:MAG: CoA ester lyase [Armatimonadota bacterium]|nr:CoA ester lyase [Armatimonadota bacterium]
MVPPRLERSILVVPASSARMIEKALASGADAVLVDLEDAVPPEHKAPSRANVVRALQDLDWTGRVCMFRINALDTPWAYGDLVEILESAGTVVDCVMVPKVGRIEDVTFVATLLDQLELAAGGGRRIGIEAQIETALGVVNVDLIAAASDRLEALVFGPGDYAASMGMPSTAIGVPDEWDARYPGHRWHYPMHRIVVAARARGLRAQDGPFAGVRDLEGFRRSCEVARAMGFDGKWCVHPAQVPIANEVFSPTEAEVIWARRVLEAYEQARRDGRGVLAVDGRMVDAASVRMAQAVVHKARQIRDVGA